MKKKFLTAAAALVLAASVHAQSTVDSIEAKYKMQPMPGALTMEQTFPIIGSYQLTNSTEGTGTLTVNLDSSNKGLVWVDGLPQGRVKAYLRQSPATYRIVSQKSASGKQVQEGTMYYDTTAHTLHIAIGKSYDDAQPTAIFASSTDMNNSSADMNTATTDQTDTKTNAGNTKVKAKGNQVKMKSKTAAGKDKMKVWFYTATKVMQGADMMNNNQTQASDSTHQQ